MNKTRTRAIVAGGFVASAFALHLREIAVAGELTAAALLVTAVGAGFVVGHTCAQRDRDELDELRGTVARIREDQKRTSQRFEVVDAEKLEDEA